MDDMKTHSIIKELAEQKILNQNLVGMSIGLIEDNSEMFFNFGTKNLKTNEVATENTLYELASIGKLFTTAMLQIGKSRGDFNFEDTIDKHLKSKVKLSEKCKANLLNLATHTSGFPSITERMLAKITNFKNPYKDLSIADLHNYLELCDENKKLGEYEYSNLGMGILGYIFELKYGKTYEAIIKKEICQKVGMTNTTITLTKRHNEDLAQGYDEEGQESEIWIDEVMTGAGSFLSNTKDMLKFISANLDSNYCEISNDLQKCHLPMFKDFVGLGWHIESINFSDKIHWHNGGTAGCSTFLCLDKKSKLGLIILSNSAKDITDFGFNLMATLMNKTKQ